jgi:putative colanic acid biosynthesis glycosyltransferase
MSQIPTTVFQINVTLNSGSTGKIAEGIGQQLLDAGHKSYIAYGRDANPSTSQAIRIGNRLDLAFHLLSNRLLDNQGFASAKATKALIHQLQVLQPDIIHLHNLHGYYLHVGLLFEYLATVNNPIVWTLHDCWPFTGHCVFFDYVACDKWKTACHSCPQKKIYPSSYVLDRSSENFHRKKELFTAVADRLHIVTPSRWLEQLVKQSFLASCHTHHIPNGIDLQRFAPSDSSRTDLAKQYGIPADKKIILGVASTWSRRKGLPCFLQLAERISSDWHIVLVGLSKEQLGQLPPSITGIPRTNRVEDLVDLYTQATVFFNPTLQDNFPTTNLEALACGTPVLTYPTGGSPEAIDDGCGWITEPYAYEQAWNLIQHIAAQDQEQLSARCRQRALEHYNQTERFQSYLQLYKQLLS